MGSRPAPHYTIYDLEIQIDKYESYHLHEQLCPPPKQLIGV